MKKILSLMLCVTLLLSLATVTVSAAEDPFTVSGTIGDYMVLQRDTENNIWGWSDKTGKKITVSFKGQSVDCTVGSDGRWCAVLPKMAADKNENDLTVTMDSFTKTFSGILVGDVYLVGGQSNAEKTLSACGKIYSTAFKEEMINAADDNIRLFKQSKTDATSSKNKDKMLTPQENVLPGKKWKKETRSSANEFSAIGFFFAHKVYEATNVPIGMIMVASGGSPVSQLMSKEASDKTGYTRYENNIPVSGMYNTLMSPFIKTSVKGMIFYQGESENGLALSDYGKYNVYVNAYVEDLREKMNQNFPFYYVQLSSHVVDQWQGTGEQRAVQFDGLNMIKNSGMVVSMDQGFRAKDSDFAHPNYKKPVGDRLADLALSRLYGIGDEKYVTSPVPLYSYIDGENIIVKFDNVGDGLKKLGQHDKLSGFKIKVNGSYRNADATVISKDEVALKAERIADQVTGVSYGTELLAFVDYPEGNGDLKYVANLGNSSDLPAPAFKITTLKEKPAEVTPTPEATAAPTVTAEPDATADPEATGKPSGSTPTATADAGTKQPEKSNTGLVIGIVAGAVVVVGAAVAGIVIAKKKKNK